MYRVLGLIALLASVSHTQAADTWSRELSLHVGKIDQSSSGYKNSFMSGTGEYFLRALPVEGDTPLDAISFIERSGSVFVQGGLERIRYGDGDKLNETAAGLGLNFAHPDTFLTAHLLLERSDQKLKDSAGNKLAESTGNNLEVGVGAYVARQVHIGLGYARTREDVELPDGQTLQGDEEDSIFASAQSLTDLGNGMHLGLEAEVRRIDVKNTDDTDYGYQVFASFYPNREQLIFLGLGFLRAEQKENDLTTYSLGYQIFLTPSFAINAILQYSTPKYDAPNDGAIKGLSLGAVVRF